MPNIITEAQIEQATIGVLVHNLGYTHINAEHNDTTGRTSEEEVVLRPRLRAALKTLNPGVPESAIDEAMERLCDIRSHMGELQGNREVHNLITEGIPVTITNKQGKEERIRLRVIDFGTPAQNDFLVVSQLWIAGRVCRRRPDLLIFVNGLPLVFIEIKNSNVALKTAYDHNLTNYRAEIPSLFLYNTVCMLSNGIETVVGGFNSGWAHFFPWQRAEREDEAPDIERVKTFGVSLDYAVRGLCHKARLLDYLENFVLFYKGSTKVCAKNHQFLGVNNAIDSFKTRLAHDAAGTDEGNRGKLGVFWHTQGSGKSFSMIFFARKIFRKIPGNYTFLIVTDRDDLDSQIYRNFLHAGAFSKDAKCQPASSEDLRGMLGTNTRYIFSLIHKFRWDKGKKYPLLSERSDIIVIIDEAHRTQYKDLAENMRAGLPNAQYIAFTGTPLLGNRQLTNEWFGATVSEYNFKQSVEDGATVPLYYSKRVPEVALQNSALDEDFAEIISDENLTDEQQQRLEREFGQELTILRSDDRLEKIARDIVHHFPRRGYLGKGMVICIDKFTAVRMYDKVRRLWEEEKRTVQRALNTSPGEAERKELKARLEWMRETDMAVVVSEENGEEEKFRAEGMDIAPHRERMDSVDESGLELEDKFKADGDPLRLVFVCSMWLTGFDAPTVSTLYLDKPMKDHTLMQTIARANRVTDYKVQDKGKHNGEILAYYNVFGNLKKAFASYGGGSTSGGDDGRSPAESKDALFGLLTDAVTQCRNWCAGLGIALDDIVASEEVFHKVGLFDQYADKLLATDEQKMQFCVYASTVDGLYEACKPEITSRRHQYPMVQVVRYLKDVMDDKRDRGAIGAAKRRLGQLLNESIVSEPGDAANTGTADDGMEYRIKAWKEIDLSKLDVAKLKEEYAQAAYKHIEIADLRAFIQAKLEQLLSRNVTRQSFAQKLEEIINRYNAGGTATEDYFDELMAFMKGMQEEEGRHIREGLTEEELEIFDLLKKEKLTKDELQTVKLAAKGLMKRLKEERPTVLVKDWHKDTQSTLVVMSAIQKVLNQALPQSYDRQVYEQKCSAVFTHIYQQAFGMNRGLA